MIYQMDVIEPHLLLWPFPELDARPNPAMEPLSAAPDSPRHGADEVEQGGGSDAAASIGELAEEPIAKGYAEGWQRGLAEGREKGYAAGIEAATAAAEQAVATQARQLAAIVARLGAPIAALERPVEEAVAALAIEVARCVIGGETSRSREYLVRLIGEAVGKVPIEMGPVKVVVHPADLELIRALAPDIEDSGAALVGDDTIEPGDCLVVADGHAAPVKDLRWRPRTGEGMSQVDLSLAARWRNVMRLLFEGEEK